MYFFQLARLVFNHPSLSTAQNKEKVQWNKNYITNIYTGIIKYFFATTYLRDRLTRLNLAENDFIWEGLQRIYDF